MSKIRIRANWSQKTSNVLEKSNFSYVFDSFFPFFMPKSELLPSLFAHSFFFKEQLERFAPVALYKRATMSNSLWSLMTKEGRERFAFFHEKIALSLTKNKRIARKTNKRIPNPGRWRSL